MKKKFNKGFTLIELLVVIAIIGILASVILASLSSARAKGTDAAIKSDFTNARAQAEIFYDIGQTYANVCTTPVTPGNGIKDMLTDAATKFGGSAVFTPGNTTTPGALVIACHDGANGWAAAAPLKTSGGTTFFCIDSTGTVKPNSPASPVPLASGSVTCT